MILSVPITNEHYNVPIWLWKRNWDYFPVIENKRTKTTRCPLKVQRWKIEKAPNLILHLKLISPIPLWRNRTVVAKKTILPRITSHLNSRPVKTNHLQSCLNINRHIVIRCGMLKHKIIAMGKMQTRKKVCSFQKQPTKSEEDLHPNGSKR